MVESTPMFARQPGNTERNSGNFNSPLHAVCVPGKGECNVSLTHNLLLPVSRIVGHQNGEFPRIYAFQCFSQIGILRKWRISQFSTPAR